MPESPPKPSTSTWLHPNQVLQLHRLKAKKKALQARINSSGLQSANENSSNDKFEDKIAEKRKNPFLNSSQNKRNKPVLDDTSDQTLFKLFNLSSSKTETNPITSFSNILSKISEDSAEKVQIVKAKEESWIPIDWSLKSKVLFLSSAPFAWNQKLKISEEASGITAFTRCLDSDNRTTLDTSPNAKFHQCCLYWQHPCLPWLSLFPRTNNKTTSATINLYNNAKVKDSLRNTWTKSFQSVFQLIRTRQCPYFYACANTFTVLFRAGGICGFTEMHAMVTPTTRGFRHLLRQEGIEYTMPLKKKRFAEAGDEDTLNEEAENLDDDEDEWLQDMGIKAEDIRQIKYTQARITHKTECEVDNSEQSLILVEGMEVHALYNFLINCKSIVAPSGPLNGVPPTLFAPVAFHEATLQWLKVHERKVNEDNIDYYSIEISGPILPSTIHNLCSMSSFNSSFTATFSNVEPTVPLSKVTVKEKNSGEENVNSGVVFGQENLRDCGLSARILKHFCAANSKYICNVECLKYTADTNTFTWT